MATPSVTPSGVEGAARLKAYWATGKGREQWVNSPHPYTTLHTLLLKYVSGHVADGLAANIFRLALGYWPSSRGGVNPAGPG